MICKDTIEELFESGEIIPCNGSDEMALSIVSINDDHIQLRPAAAAAELIILNFDNVLAAVNGASGTMNNQPIDQPLQCFVYEYLRRVEEARRDAEVEAMWLSAGVCQIP